MAQAVPYIMLALTAASTAVTVKGQKDQARVIKQEAEAESKREGDAARSREIERRRALLKALASQTAEAGAYGASPDASIAKRDIEEAKLDLLTDQANTGNIQSSLRARGRNATRAARNATAGALLDFGSSAAGIYKDYNKL